jgi:hypothetical protein
MPSHTSYSSPKSHAQFGRQSFSGGGSLLPLRPSFRFPLFRSCRAAALAKADSAFPQYVKDHPSAAVRLAADAGRNS